MALNNLPRFNYFHTIGKQEVTEFDHATPNPAPFLKLEPNTTLSQPLSSLVPKA